MLNFIPTEIKSLLTMLWVMLTIALGMSNCIYKGANTNLRKELAVCESQAAMAGAIYDSERIKSKKTIEDQSKAIQDFKLDTVTYANTVNSREKSIISSKVSKQNTIQKELDKDSSSANQLKIINDILVEFGNAKN